MAYDEKLAERIRKVLPPDESIVERKMFGGVAWMIRGNMFVGIVKNDLMVRVGKEGNAAALAQPHARPMDFSGKPMDGYVYVAPPGVASDKDLAAWVDRGATFALSLPPK
ncbi:MAG: TfoX/Sxy family protein [Candidatus Sericytochromatia bacterium]|nr:TfoX/Sxy family protein [Candidatus Tanganyikabacteria bacterium]